MILLHLKLDNIYGFRNFEIDFTYPKKIVNSIIEEEHLPGRPNFRYKKAVALMGANATGKTSLGKAIQRIVDCLNGDYFPPHDFIPKNQLASFQIDLVNHDFVLYRYIGEMDPNLRITAYSTEIGSKDSYETAVEKLSPGVVCDTVGRWPQETDNLNYTFSSPDIKPAIKFSDIDQSLLLKTLQAVIGTLDPTLTDVSLSKDLRNTFIIRRNNEEIIIQEGKLLNREALSSGTAEGVDISLFLARLIAGQNGLYYCDEHFSYIQSDIEKRLFGLMLEHLGPNEQLIFTTHNTDMLDLNLPKHSFAFLKNKMTEDGHKVSVTWASDILKRNTDSLRAAVENDVFSSLPDESLLDTLEKGCL